MRVAQAATQREVLGHRIVHRAERRPRGVLLVRVDVAGGQAGRGRVVGAAGGVALVEEVQAALPAQRAGRGGLDAELLRDLTVAAHRAGRLGREAGLAFLRERLGAAIEVAAVHVAAAERAHRLVAGDRVQVDRAQAPAQAGAAAGGVQGLLVDAVGVGLLGIEAVDQVVGAGLDDRRAEHARAALQVAAVEVEQRAEVLVRLVQRLHAQGAVVVALELAGLAGRDLVLDPVVAVLDLRRDAGGPVAGQRHVGGALQAHRAVVAVGDVQVAFLALRGLHRIELDHAGRRVAAVERALRTGHHFDGGQVEGGEALEDRVLLDHVVINQRDRLRRVQAEVGVAVAADVEAREGAAERGFDVQAGHAARQETDVLAAGVQHVQLLAGDLADRVRHFLDVLDPALGGDGHRLQLALLLGRRVGGVLGQRGPGEQGQRHGRGGLAQGRDGNALGGESIHGWNSGGRMGETGGRPAVSRGVLRVHSWQKCGCGVARWTRI